MLQPRLLLIPHSNCPIFLFIARVVWWRVPGNSTMEVVCGLARARTCSKAGPYFGTKCGEYYRVIRIFYKTFWNLPVKTTEISGVLYRHFAMLRPIKERVCNLNQRSSSISHRLGKGLQ